MLAVIATVIDDRCQRSVSTLVSSQSTQLSWGCHTNEQERPGSHVSHTAGGSGKRPGQNSYTSLGVRGQLPQPCSHTGAQPGRFFLPATGSGCGLNKTCESPERSASPLVTGEVRQGSCTTRMRGAFWEYGDWKTTMTQCGAPRFFAPRPPPTP